MFALMNSVKGMTAKFTSTIQHLFRCLTMPFNFTAGVHAPAVFLPFSLPASVRLSVSENPTTQEKRGGTTQNKRDKRG